MAASPCSGSMPNVNGSTMITVMVLVMPGSAPPTMPTSVPTASGTKYFMCSTFAMPARSSSYILEIRPAAARQQHLQVALEKHVADQRRDQRRHADRDPA